MSISCEALTFQAVPVPGRLCTAQRITRKLQFYQLTAALRVLQKEAPGGLQELLGGLAFLSFTAISSHIWLLRSGCAAFCCLLKSQVFTFFFPPQLLSRLLSMSVPFWQGYLKNELYFPFWQGRGERWEQEDRWMSK